MKPSEHGQPQALSSAGRFPTILDTIGGTPVVRLQRIGPRPEGTPGPTLLAKLEGRNPGGSVKDRIARAMIEAAEAEGRLKPGDTVVEPTSGNTGVGLAVVCAAKGYRLILTMPEGMSEERRRLFRLLGAELVETPRIEGMSGSIFAARELVEKRGYFMPMQFDNPANPEAHRRTTAQEILEATGGKLDVFVAGVGTGGTLTGAGEILKQEIPGIRIVAVEPAQSATLSGGPRGLTRIQGLGAGFVPGVLNREVYDEVVPVTDEDALRMTVRLAREEGILAGISSGAAVAASVEVARRLRPGQTLLTILPDLSERYLSVLEV
ncbi:cysteine synthase A [Limnochorda pilosa]|uniref:Cysteine synthase n=1 Tax=Limnochorda pilosa TaxID=1555112 RepID=A0A0K2SFP7_LIMPI|nr:cysteine synthase A [Limnochorda pilosa]BAS25915.1 cysteine synthase [Limnochorda pilosa]